MDSTRQRIDWETDVGDLAAVEPGPDQVSAHAGELAVAYNEPANARLMGHTERFSADDVVAHFAALRRAGARAFLLFRNGRLAGDADLRRIDGGAAEFAFMIGAREQQGRGLGTRFALMVCAFAFDHLGLERVYASVLPANVASRRVFEKLGFARDESPQARAFADEPGDVTVSIDRAAFDRRHRATLVQLRVAPR